MPIPPASPGLTVAPTSAAPAPAQSASTARVGEGALRFSHSGERFILGYGTDFFGIWDRTRAGGPAVSFPRSDDGWTEAWNRFSAWESTYVAVPQAGTPPSVGAATPGSEVAHGRARLVVGLIAAVGILTIIQLVFQVLELNLLYRADRGDAVLASEWNANETGQEIAAGIAGALGIAAVVLWLMWQFRAHANLTEFGARDLEYTPGWAVGWWFIPVANLVIPYLAMRELHRASDPDAGPTDWKSRSTPALLWVWWALWLGVVLLNTVAIVLALGTDPPTDRLIASAWFGITAALLYLVNVVLAIRVVRLIDARQQLKATRLATATQPAWAW